jgi:hypothetical protein
MQRLTGFETESRERGKYLTTDVLTIPILPGSHINKLLEGATTSDTSLSETDVLLETGKYYS